MADEILEQRVNARRSSMILEEMIEQGRATAMAVASHEELGPPLLLTARVEDGTVVERMNFRVTVQSIHPSDSCKVILAGTKATHGVIVFEAWEYDAEASDEEQASWAAAAQAGERPMIHSMLRPSLHPDRYEALTIIGQTKMDGQLCPVAQRSWKITTPAAGQARVFEARHPPADWVNMPSKFNPLFGERREIYRITAQYAEAQRLLNQTRERRS